MTDIHSFSMLWFSLTLLIGGGIVALLLEYVGISRHTVSVVSHLTAMAGSACAALFGIAQLLHGTILSFTLPIPIGIMPDILSFRIDPLAAFFIIIISLVACAASLYGIGYQKQFYASTYHLGFFGFCYNLFIASMLIIVTANHALLFLTAWEIMATVSYCLVVFEHKHEENIHAGTLYILMTQAGTAFLFAAFLYLYHFTGSWNFDIIRAGITTISPLMQNVILALALIGFSTKAGVIPLHIWLPEAHPAAPSHVSAIMSGVMIKTAIFMIIRFFFDFFPHTALAWGLVLLVLGAISSLLGVLYAFSETDIKRLLAYSSVENIGIILLGVGVSITFFAAGVPLLGTIALAAALYHILNHAFFKSLLFLSTGSVVRATQTRNMEEYGGLIKIMPYTAVFFLMGAIAISGLPPFNGFVSEWLTFHALFAGIISLPIVAKVIFLIGATSLAFTGGLAAACFVKAFGVTFLARARSYVWKQHANESEGVMLWGMGILTVCIVLCGLLASTLTPLFEYIVASIGGSAAPSFTSPIAPLVISGATLSMIVVALVLALGIAVAYFLYHLTRRAYVTARTWDCGANLTPRMEITATGFSRSLMVIFKGILRPTRQTSVEYHDADSRYVGSNTHVEMHLEDVYHSRLYRPIIGAVDWLSGQSRKIQGGNLNVYLLYMFITTAALLWWVLK